ncbi:nitroreductase family deazaflavin-dependent oxidoreductase [Angustibacter peucedani]
MSPTGSAADPWQHLAARTYGQANPLHQLVRRLGAWRPMSWLLARTLHHLDRPVSRLTHGRRTATSAITGLTVAVLTTRGRRSGQPRESPLLGFAADGGFVVIASNYGQPHHPGWYHNLLADPGAELLVEGIMTPVTARLVEGEQRARMWGQAVALYPGWQAYEARCAPRPIGVFLLVPRSS